MSQRQPTRQQPYYPDYPGPYVQPPQNRQQQLSYNQPSAMSVGQWVGTLLLLLIPFVNVICYIVWLFGGGSNKTRTNWVRASLLVALIPIIIIIIAIVALGGFAAITDMLGNLGYTG